MRSIILCTAMLIHMVSVLFLSEHPASYKNLKIKLGVFNIKFIKGNKNESSISSSIIWDTT